MVGRALAEMDDSTARPAIGERLFYGWDIVLLGVCDEGGQPCENVWYEKKRGLPLNEGTTQVFRGIQSFLRGMSRPNSALLGKA